VAIRPNDYGLRLFDIRTGSLLRDLERRGRRVLSLVGNSESERLITVEQVIDPTRMLTRIPTLPGWISLVLATVHEPAPPNEDFEVVLWDVNRLDTPIAVLSRFSQRRGMVMAAFGYDGKTVALAFNRNPVVYLFSAGDGEPLATIDTQAEQLNGLALGANNVMATAAGSTIQLWDTEAKTFLSSLTSTRGFSRLVRFNPQGTLLAAAAGANVEIWDTMSHKLLAVLPPAEWITDLAFTPDGRTLAVGGWTDSTSVWEISDSSARLQIGGFEGRPTSLAFRADGTLGIGGSNGDVWLYHPGGTRCTVTSRPTTGPMELSLRGGERERDREWNRRMAPSLMFDSAGKLVAHDSRGLRIWDFESPPAHSPTFISLPSPAAGPFRNQALLGRSADGQLMVLVRSSEVSLWHANHPDRVEAVEAPSPRSEEGRVPLPTVDQRPAAPAFAAAAMTPKNSRPARPGGGGRPGPPGWQIYAVQISLTGDRIYMLAERGRLSVWALDPGAGATPARARRVDLSPPLDKGMTFFSCLALRPDGELLAIGDRTGGVTLVDASGLSVVGTIRNPGHEGENMVVSMAFSPDGQFLAVGTIQGQILVWSMGRSRLPHLRFRLSGQRGAVSNLVFDAQSQRLASCCGNGEPIVEIWNLATLKAELDELGLGE
jgi:WD40 repeat protein